MTPRSTPGRAERGEAARAAWIVPAALVIGFVPAFGVDGTWLKAQNLLFGLAWVVFVLGLTRTRLRRRDVPLLLGVPLLLLAQALGTSADGFAGTVAAPRWTSDVVLKQLRDPLTAWLLLVALLTRPGSGAPLRTTKTFLFGLALAATAALVAATLAPTSDLAARFANPRGFIAGFEGPNSLGAATALAIPFTLAWLFSASTWRSRATSAATLAMVVLLLFLSGSRGALIGLVVGALAAGGSMITLARSRAIRLPAVATAMVAATLVIVAVLAVPNDPVERLLRTDLLAVDADPSTSRRATQLATAVELAARSPVFGTGFGGYAFGYSALKEGVLPSTTPHNGPLHLTAQGGIVGLAALLAYYLVIFLVAWQALHRRRDAWGIAAVATATVLIVLDQFFPYLLTHDVGAVAALMLAATVQMGRVECP